MKIITQFSNSNNDKSKCNQDMNGQIINNNNYNKKKINKLYSINICLEDNKIINNSNNIKNNINVYNNIKNNDISSSNLPFKNLNIVNELNSQNSKNANNITLSNVKKPKTLYIKKNYFHINIIYVQYLLKI